MTWQKREREPPARKGLGQPPPKPPQHAFHYGKPHQSPRVIHHQHQGEKTLHDPAQARCQETFSRTETGYFQKKNYLVAESKEDTNAASGRPPLKEESKMEEEATSMKAKNVAGAQIVLSVKPKRKKKKKLNSRSCHQIYQSLKLKDPIH